MALEILHVVPTYLPATRYGGPIYSVHGLCRALVRRGHRVEVLTTSVDGPGDSDVPLEVPVDVDGVRVRYFPSRRLRRLYFSPPMARELARLLPPHARGDDGARASIQVVHLHSIYLWPTAAAARSARRAGVPYVVSPRGMLVRELVAQRSRLVKSAWIGLVERRTFQDAAAIHFTSERELEEARRFSIALPSPVVIPNGVEIPATTAPAPAREPFVLYVGRMSWVKRIDMLIAAMAWLPGHRLVIAGNDEEGMRPRLERVVEELGLGERVELLDPVFGETKASLLARASLFALPSASENFGNAVLEAMAAGCPVVVTSGVGLADAVRRAGAGIVVDDATAEGLGRAMAELLSSPGHLREMGARGVAVVERDFTWDRVAARMEEVYGSTALGGHPTSG